MLHRYEQYEWLSTIVRDSVKNIQSKNRSPCSLTVDKYYYKQTQMQQQQQHLTQFITHKRIHFNNPYREAVINI